MHNYTGKSSLFYESNFFNDLGCFVHPPIKLSTHHQLHRPAANFNPWPPRFYARLLICTYCHIWTTTVSCSTHRRVQELFWKGFFFFLSTRQQATRMAGWLLFFQSRLSTVSYIISNIVYLQKK